MFALFVGPPVERLESVGTLVPDFFFGSLFYWGNWLLDHLLCVWRTPLCLVPRELSA